jgi:sarcosine oxidase
MESVMNLATGAAGPPERSGSADVIVVGLGAVGAASVYHLARAGVRVLGIDRHHPPHDQGSSHGETRASRLAVGEGDVFVPLVLRSHELWREMEAATGESLLDACGVLMIDTTGGESNVHGLGGFFERAVEIARRWGIAHEVIDGDEVRRRHPAFLAPPEARAYYEPDGGLVYPERCVAVQLRLAREAGAVVRTGETVLDIASEGQGAVVTTDKGRYGADRVVIAAGAWTPGLVGPRLGGLRLLRQVLHWFDPADVDLYRRGAVPVFLWLHGPQGSDTFYGFPAQPGDGRVKVATEQYASETPCADDLDRHVTPREGADLFDTHLKGRLAHLATQPARSVACVYTSTPDARFIVDTLPGDESILVASACSGHGFKHSPAIGEHIAALILGTGRRKPEFAMIQR